MKCVLGIDIGGSTTKIVGFDGERLIGCIKVRASDPETSAFGAFGKFVSAHSISMENISKIFLTGVGASFIGDSFYNLPSAAVDEITAIGIGGQYLSGIDRAVVVSMGTGTAFVRISDGEIRHIGGSGVGGGTLLGLAEKMLGVKHFENILELAATGNLANVDLTVGDISRASVSNMPMDTTASNFGKISDTASSSDIAAGLLNMVLQTVCMLSAFAASGSGICNVVLTGNLSVDLPMKKMFDFFKQMYNITFLTPKNAEFATAIGAALYASPPFADRIKAMEKNSL